MGNIKEKKVGIAGIQPLPFLHEHIKTNQEKMQEDLSMIRKCF